MHTLAREDSISCDQPSNSWDIGASLSIELTTQIKVYHLLHNIYLFTCHRKLFYSNMNVSTEGSYPKLPKTPRRNRERE